MATGPEQHSGSVGETPGSADHDPVGRRALAPYRAVARSAFRQFSTYRGATLAGIVTNTAFGFIFASVFDAVHDQAGDVGGFSASDTALYVFVAQAFLMMTGAFGDREISERIRTGDIAADLYRPVDFQLWWLAHDTGKSAFYALARGVPPLTVGIVVLDIALPTAPWQWAAFALAAFGGVQVAFTIRFIANLTSFWLLDGKGVVALAGLTQIFLAGHVAPLYFMPSWLESIARLLPFAAITAHPIEVLLGAHRGWSLAAIFAHQLLWFAALSLAGRAVLASARRKLVIQGG